MAETPLKIPSAIPVRPPRPVQENIPPTRVQREELLQMVRQYVAEQKLVPPLPFDELKIHADRLIEQYEVRRIIETSWPSCSTTLVGATFWRPSPTRSACCCCRFASAWNTNALHPLMNSVSSANSAAFAPFTISRKKPNASAPKLRVLF